MPNIALRLLIFIFLLAFTPIPANAAECAVDDRSCIIKELQSSATGIENASWRDQTYREIAKTLAFEGDIDGAIALITKIETPDTKAMTIRGIGMAATPLSALVDLPSESGWPTLQLSR